MKRILRWIAHGVLTVALLAFGALLAWAFESRNMPPLQLWHTATLRAEFTAADAATVDSLEAYLEQEARLFDELKRVVIDPTPETDDLAYNRYLRDGPQNPETLDRNWNRSFELVPDEVRGGALLMHGLTDSPYSVRAAAEVLHARGFYVLGLRLPAHGTIPAALAEVHWKDWVAASRIGARHVRERIGSGLPFVIGGYSNGGALTIKYALDALDDERLPAAGRLLLLSPEVGISRAAAIANSYALLSFLPYFAQFRWLSIEPEFDPFKYNSFPKNAAQQAHDLTEAVHDQIRQARAAGRFADFPPVLTFLSWVDATVETSATTSRLYAELENEGSELVVFDVNRLDQVAPLIPATREAPLDRLFARTDLPYRLTIIENESGGSIRVAERTRAPRSQAFETRPFALRWPKGVYSLAHVAIPFPLDDPVYGVAAAPTHGYRGLRLGALAPRGETHLLTVPVGQLMRLRHNPFFPYVEHRIGEVIDATLATTSGVTDRRDPR
jgi:alpha-beta hydrolase superfamily lysophospholipase